MKYIRLLLTEKQARVIRLALKNAIEEAFGDGDPYMAAQAREADHVLAKLDAANLKAREEAAAAASEQRPLSTAAERAAWRQTLEDAGL